MVAGAGRDAMRHLNIVISPLDEVIFAANALALILLTFFFVVDGGWLWLVVALVYGNWFARFYPFLFKLPPYPWSPRCYRKT